MASARAIYRNNDCSLTETCYDRKVSKITRVLKITTDNCSVVTCPKNCTSGICNKNLSINHKAPGIY